MHSVLELVLALLAAAVGAVVLFRKLHMPPMLGYLAVGVAFGPHALGIAPDTAVVHMLAEFGVVFLMFSIGLEFSLPKLRAMRVEVFGLGGTQVTVTMLGTLLAGFVAERWLSLSWAASLALGGALAMSSTAIVSKLLAERGEMDTPHGRAIFGVLLFQDLAVVPLLIVVPTLARGGDDLWMSLGLAAVKIVFVLTLLLVFGQRLMRSWFQIVARRRSQELFMLNLLFITLGCAWVTEIAGLSLALGAFVAGMLISETEFRYQVEEDIKPFRDVLLGLFFVTVGMQLDLRVVWQQWWLVLLFVVLPLVGKFGLIVAAARAFRLPVGTSLRVGLWLTQAGEFGFVLLNQVGQLHLVPQQYMQPILAAMVLSMIVAPFVIQNADALVMRWSASEWMQRSLDFHRIAARSLQTEKHLIICGFGRCGQNLASLLEEEGVPYVALDLDPERVREAAASGESVVYGDAARKESLMAAGLSRASAVIITYSDAASATRVLHHVRSLAPHLPVVVRTRDDADLDRLRDAGAAEVVPEVVEGSLMLASHAMALAGIPLHRVIRRIRNVRDSRYQLLRGYFHGADDDAEVAGEGSHIRLLNVALPAGAAVIGKTLADTGLDFMGVEVAALRRRDRRTTHPEPELVLEPGDVIVVRGTAASVASAEEMLTRR